MELDECIREVGKSIMDKMGKLTGVRVYVSITDREGNFIYFDSAFENYKDFIKDFVQANFLYLSHGDHSIPLSSENIIFFKSTAHAMIILFNPKGKIGQLLTFKSMVNEYSDSIERCTLKIESVSIEMSAKSSISLEMPPMEIKVPIFSRREKMFKNIKPTLGKKFKGKEKFNFEETLVLNKCDGNQSLFDILESPDLKDFEIIDILHKFFSKKVVLIEDYQILKVPCPQCKNSANIFIPKFILDNLETNLRVQLFPEGCEHTYVAFIDKKLKIKTKIMENLFSFHDSLDISNLSIKNLISFFGQDVFFALFHALFFQLNVIFIGEAEFVKDIIQFLKKIFPQIEYKQQISSIERDEFKKNSKKYKDYLIIDFDSNIIIDPYQEKLFDFELKLFKKILEIEDENLQILQTNSEFERLILLTDMILKEIKSFSQISEDILIDNMKVLYKITIERYEIPIIKKLAEIYYDTDISKKVTETVLGTVSGWLDKM